MDGREWNRKRVCRSYRLSGGTLQIPRTPVERIMLDAKLKRLKLESDHRRKGQP